MPFNTITEFRDANPLVEEDQFTDVHSIIQILVFVEITNPQDQNELVTANHAMQHGTMVN